MARAPRGLVVGADPDGRPGLVVQRRRRWRVFALVGAAVGIATGIVTLGISVLTLVALLPMLLRGGVDPLLLDVGSLTIGRRTIGYDQILGARVVGTLNSEVHVTPRRGGDIRVFIGSARECAWIVCLIDAARRGEVTMPLPVMRALPERS